MDRQCEESRLSAYLDGELGEEGAARLERHLAECAQCRARFRALERIGATLRRTRPQAPPGARLRGPLGVAATRARRHALAWRWAASRAPSRSCSAVIRL